MGWRSLYLLVSNLLKGSHLVRAVTGAEAVKKARVQTFDVVFMDMRMPVMDGLEAVSLIRKSDTTIPVVALTANAFDSDKDAVLAAGCNYFMTKPIKKQELMGLLDRITN